ncbi:MAG: single-stranded DNA-binding protein, partial [Kovacikia sp.]
MVNPHSSNAFDQPPQSGLPDNLPDSSSSQEPTLKPQASSIPYAATPHANMQITDDLNKLLEILPAPIQHQLAQHPEKDGLVEVVLDLGRRPEARFPGQAEYLSEVPVSQSDLNECIARVGDFGGDNRAGIERTLHRISAIRNRRGEVIGLTCRVGRAIYGTIGMIRDLVESGRSILMLGRPG